MRSLRTLVLAALAVLVAMAFVRVTSASAVTALEEVVLCKASEDPCAVNNHFPSGTVLHGTATDPVLLGSTGLNILCEASHVLGNTSSLLAHGLITSLTWLNCEDEEAGKVCNVTTNNLPYLVQTLLTSNDTNYHTVVTKHTEGAGRPSWRIANCAALDCSYGATTILFDVLSDGLGTLLDILQTLSGEGGFCVFTSGVWHAQYRVHCLNASSETKPCWVSMEGKVQNLADVVGCKVQKDPCPEGEHLPFAGKEGTLLHGEAKDVELLGLIDVSCERSVASGSTTSLLIHGQITELSFINCVDEEEEECTVTAGNLPYLVKGELQSGHGSYELLVTESGEGRPEARVQCSGLDCRYGAKTLLFKATADKELGTTVLGISETLTGEGLLCVGSGVWDAEYAVIALLPISVWVAMEEE